jgi:hypothetical protein
MARARAGTGDSAFVKTDARLIDGGIGTAGVELSAGSGVVSNQAGKTENKWTGRDGVADIFQRGAQETRCSEPVTPDPRSQARPMDRPGSVVSA